MDLSNKFLWLKATCGVRFKIQTHKNENLFIYYFMCLYPFSVDRHDNAIK